jgi:hypothetical protein
MQKYGLSEYRAQQREYVLFEHGGLIYERRVEKRVRLLLIGEYPLLFAPAHALPHGKRLLHARAAHFMIAHHAPQQPDIRGADAVVVVEVERISALTYSGISARWGWGASLRGLCRVCPL